MRHCIVTPELAPFTRNGGVGTNALHLSEFLVEESGAGVVILVTQAISEEIKHDPALRERVGHVTVLFLQDIVPLFDTSKSHSRRLAVSMEVLWWLRGQDFDVVHAMQYTAPGFASIRAKKLGTDFPHTRFVTIMNSPERWLAEHGKRLPDGSASGLVLDFMERYCVANGDHVTCPTSALVEWMRSDGWTLAERTWQLPTYSPPPPPFNRQPMDRHHLVFFGRLETRKGLEIFVEAINLLGRSKRHAALPLRITFLGKISMAAGQSSEAYLRDHMGALPPGWTWEVLCNLDQPQAMAYLEQHSGALFVMPSLTDNSPNTVLECLARDLRILCSDAPGVSELFADKSALVAPRPSALAARLGELIVEGSLAPAAAVSRADAVALRRRFLEALAEPFPAQSPAPRPEDRPSISVIVPHYNSAAWLPQALDSLRRQDYSNFEVIVIDDGSTCKRSLAIVNALEQGDRDPRFRYFRQPNRGVCSARNHGVSRSRGELLMFFDSDNIAMPQMLTRMEASLTCARLDVITCDLYAFRDEAIDLLPNLDLHWTFAGGPLEGALKVNCLGDSNMLVRRSCYEAVKGFRSESNEASADRALLVRLLKAGYRLDTISDPVFAYRLHGASMSATANQFERSIAVMNAFTEGLEPWMSRLLQSNFSIYGTQSSELGAADREAIAGQIKNLRNKLRVEREKRRERDRRVDYLFKLISQWRKNPMVRLARFLGSIPRQY